MDAIDEEAAPSMVEKADDFRPYFPERPDDDGFLTKLGLKKKLVKLGQGWEVPEKGDEITVHYTASVLDGPQFSSSKDMGEPLVEVIGQEHVLEGCTDGLITMRKGEISIFTVPPTISHGFRDFDRNLPLDVTLQVEVELISWLKIIDICGDGGILKKIVVKSEILERAQKKDEVIVRYQVRLEDGRPVAKSPDDGVEFLVNDGHLCPAIAKTTITMRKGEKAMVQVQPEYAFGIQGRSAREGFCAVPPNGVIIIYLELLGYKILEYVTEDMKVVKKITTTGEGFLKPNSGTTAQIRYVGKLGDGRIFDKKGFVDEDPFEFKVDEEQVISGLDLAVATMKQGEFALVKIDPEYGFGDVQTKTDSATVPPHSILYYEVEMVKFTKVKESWDMEPEEKIEYAIKRKTEGNSYFKDGKYKRASLRYDMAAKYVEFDSLFNEEQKKKGKFFKVTCNLNNAACKLKLKDFREAAKLCTKVLHLEPRNVKALFRRAQAYIETMDLDLAEFDVQKALDIQPDNGEVSQLLNKVRKSQSYYDKKEFKTYANMFTKLTVSDPIGS